MKQGFICTAAAIIFCGSCLAVSDDLMRAFDKALSDPDISVCWDAAAPLWGRAQGEGRGRVSLRSIKNRATS